MLPFHIIPDVDNDRNCINISITASSRLQQQQGQHHQGRSCKDDGGDGGGGEDYDYDQRQLPAKQEIDDYVYGHGDDGDDLSLNRGPSRERDVIDLDIDMDVNPADDVGVEDGNGGGDTKTTASSPATLTSPDNPTSLSSVAAEPTAEEGSAGFKGEKTPPSPPPSPPTSSDSTPTMGNTTKKQKRTWKKPQDKPKRPLSSYNIYFQHQRERLVDGKMGEASPEEVVTSVEAILSRGKTKRKHRKSHGKISFGDLARTIADSWKTVSPKNKSIFEHYAERDMLRYKRELKVWRDKKDMEIEADAHARHSKFMSSMGSSYSGSVDSDASISFSQFHSSTSEFIESLPVEGTTKAAGGFSSSPVRRSRPDRETMSLNSSLSSLDSQRTPIPRPRRGSMPMSALRENADEFKHDHASVIAPSSSMNIADHVIQRQQQILNQQMMLDRSNNSNNMNMSVSSHASELNVTMPQSSSTSSSLGMGPPPTHSMPSGMVMGMNMMGHHAGMNSMGVMGVGSSAGSVQSMPAGMNVGNGSNPMMMMMMGRGGNTMSMGMNAWSPLNNGGGMPFQQHNSMGFTNTLRQDMSFQQQQQHQHLQMQQQQLQMQQQQFQNQQNMAMMHSSSNSLQFGEAFGGSAAGGGGGFGGGRPNLVSDHTRTSFGHQSAAFNNSQASFAAFGNSTSSFGGGSSMMLGGSSMMPAMNSSGLSSSSYHGAGTGTGTRSQGQAGTGNGGNFPMMSQQQSGMSSASFQRRQQGHAGHGGSTNTNLLTSSSYHSGMRASSLHRTLQQETIDEHSQQDLDEESSFAFPSGEGFF